VGAGYNLFIFRYWLPHVLTDRMVKSFKSLHKKISARGSVDESHPKDLTLPLLDARNRSVVGKQVLDRVIRDLQQACVLEVATRKVSKPKYWDVVGGTGSESDKPFPPPLRVNASNNDNYFKQVEIWQKHTSDTDDRLKTYNEEVVEVATVVLKYLSDHLRDGEEFGNCKDGIELYEQLVKYTKGVTELEKQALRRTFEALCMDSPEGKLSYYEYKAQHVRLAKALEHFGLAQSDLVKQRVFAAGLSDDYVEIKVFMSNVFLKSYAEVLAQADNDTIAMECGHLLGTKTPSQLLNRMLVAQGEESESGDVSDSENHDDQSVSNEETDDDSDENEEEQDDEEEEA